MEYSLYRLNFTTPVHIGGSSLNNVQMTIHADTLFAALCTEAARQGNIRQFVTHFAQGDLTLSDALPFKDRELFLPKPHLFAAYKKLMGDVGLIKKLNSLQYIPLTSFEQFLQQLARATVSDLDNLRHDFGHPVTTARVAVKGQVPPLPYYVTAWNFASGCGLYLVLQARQAEAAKLFHNLLESLSWTGVGGKQSSGWGKFRVAEESVPDTLQELLDDDRAEYQMLLGTGLPKDEELDRVLEEGWCTLVRRGGFVRSEKYALQQLKKRTVFMLAPGSCLRRRFQGAVLDLSEHGSHPVWRTTNTLFVGVNLCNTAI